MAIAVYYVEFFERTNDKRRRKEKIARIQHGNWMIWKRCRMNCVNERELSNWRRKHLASRYFWWKKRTKNFLLIIAISEAVPIPNWNTTLTQHKHSHLPLFVCVLNLALFEQTHNYYRLFYSLMQKHSALIFVSMDFIGFYI